MPIYRALEPVSYVNGLGSVTHIAQVGATFEVTEAQAGLMDPDKIEFVGSGRNPYTAPSMTMLAFDNEASFPEEGARYHSYFAEDTGLLHRWNGGAYEVVRTDASELSDSVDDYVLANSAKFRTRPILITEGPNTGLAQWVDAMGTPIGDPVQPWTVAAVNVDEGCLHNWKPENTRRLQRSMAESLGGLARSSHLVIGDSLSSPHTGTTFDFPNSWWRTLKNLLVANGHPNGGTGAVAAVDGNDTRDPRITWSGSWTTGTTYLASTAEGNTLTFYSDVPGTAIDVYYHQWSDVFGVQVDGGELHVVNPTGTQQGGVFSLSGLTNELHAITVTAGAPAVIIAGFRVRASSGVEFHNIGVKFGQTAIGWYGDLQPASIREMTTSLISDPDVVHILLGANDIGAANSTAMATVAAIGNIRALYPNADVILYLEMQYPGKDWAEYSTRMYSLAESLDCPLVDLYRYRGNYSTLSAAGLIGADGIHPTAVYQRDVGTLVLQGFQKIGPNAKGFSSGIESLEAELENKVDIAAFWTAVADFATISGVSAVLADYATQDGITATLADYATVDGIAATLSDFATIDGMSAELNAKADLAAMTTALNGKADLAAMTTALGQKADSAAMSTALNAKVDRASAPPSSSTATGTVGQIALSTDYIYVCIATNTWVRAPLSTW